MQSTADTGGRTIITIKEEVDSSDDSAIDITGNAPAKETICVTKNEVAQAFSHCFSHPWTRKSHLFVICKVPTVSLSIFQIHGSSCPLSQQCEEG